MSDRPTGRLSGRRWSWGRDAWGAARSLVLESVALAVLVLVGLGLAALVLAIT
ncbi:MAG TPA: hypothetical protein VIL12_03600 [Acidimicrobiia bacterium]